MGNKVGLRERDKDGLREILNKYWNMWIGMINKTENKT